MITADISAETTFKHRDWNLIPDAAHSNYFDLKETKTGRVLGRFILPESSDPTLLNLIASAPELQDIAEMYHDAMVGNGAEKTMVFAIVTEVLHRVQ